MNRSRTLAMLGLPLVLAACGDSPSPPSSPTATTQERIEKDLKAVGEKVKQTAHKVAQKADPALQRAKEEAKEIVHRAAEKVAEQTAPTQPAAQL